MAKIWYVFLQTTVIDSSIIPNLGYIWDCELYDVIA